MPPVRANSGGQPDQDAEYQEVAGRFVKLDRV